MAEYTYIGISKSEGDISGEITADSHRAALDSLQSQGVHVHTLRLTETNAAPEKSPRLASDDVELLTEFLGEITSSSLSIPAGLREFSTSVRKASLNEVMETIARDVEQGSTLAQALDKHRDSFSPAYIALVRAGEQSGNLPAVLAELLRHSKELKEVRASLQEALTYPLIVLICAVGLFSLMCSMLAPFMLAIRNDIGGIDTAATSMMNFADSIGNIFDYNGYLLFAVLMVLLLIPVFLLLKFARNTDSVNHLLYRIPLIDTVYRLALLVRFSRTFEILLESNVALHDAITLAATTTGSPHVATMGAAASAKAASGSDFGTSLKSLTLLRPRDAWMLSQGEQSGQLLRAATRLRESSANEYERASRKMIKVTGPIGLVAMGLIVLGLAYSIFIPFFTLPTFFTFR